MTTLLYIQDHLSHPTQPVYFEKDLIPSHVAALHRDLLQITTWGTDHDFHHTSTKLRMIRIATPNGAVPPQRNCIDDASSVMRKREGHHTKIQAVAQLVDFSTGGLKKSL